MCEVGLEVKSLLCHSVTDAELRKCTLFCNSLIVAVLGTYHFLCHSKAVEYF